MKDKIRSVLKMIFTHFFVIYTLTMFASYAFIKLTSEPPQVFDAEYIWKAAIFSFCASLSEMIGVFLDGGGKKTLFLVITLQAALLEASLLPLGYLFGMWCGAGGFTAFFFTILLVDGLMWLFTFIQDEKTASKINENLKKKRESKEEKNEKRD